uniref:Methuselah N-terminal domain-containing protein n=1 Tax=Glossina brevipalpis TaxID=37001 RepID=A0A1A9WSB0_9MUSC
MKLLSIALLLSVLAVTLLFNAVSPITAADHKEPCKYADTVNITDSLRLKDGSYSFEGILIPVNLTASYNYKVIDGIQYSASKHMRGCVCLLKSCITFCCPPKLHYNESLQNCSPTEESSNFRHMHIEIKLHNGTEDKISIPDKFIVRYEFGCKNKYVDVKNDQFWEWDLLEDSCIKMDTYLVRSHHAHTQQAEQYIRNSNYGEGLIFHLFSLTIALILLVHLYLKNPLNLTETACRNIGFLAYFFLMLSFLILNIISGSFWATFSQIIVHSWLLKLFYALTIALAFVLKYLVKSVQDSRIVRHFKPGIGDDFCWFDVRLWGILLYVYIPIVLMTTLSLVCTLKTYCQIHKFPNGTQTVCGKDFKTTKYHFYSFCIYLLAVTSIWMREMLAYILAHQREQYFVIDFWSGVCALILSIIGSLFLLCGNRFAQQWWTIHVSKKRRSHDYTLPPSFRPRMSARYGHKKI